MNISILENDFSIENYNNDKIDDFFIIINEWNSKCIIKEWFWDFKCLKINTKYSDKNYWILKNIANIFSSLWISIFVFTSIDYWYFFFNKNYLKKIIKEVIPKINY